MLTLRQLLTMPYILYLEARPDEHGVWRRVASYPELDGCTAVADTAWDAVDALEQSLPAYLVENIVKGNGIWLPDYRPGLPYIDAERRLTDAGLTEWIEVLDLPLDRARERRLAEV